MNLADVYRSNEFHVFTTWIQTLIWLYLILFAYLTTYYFPYFSSISVPSSFLLEHLL